MQPIQHLTLEIIDYPGEWLLDLPLLEESFAQFSHDALALAEQPVRRAAAAAVARAGSAAFDADAPEDEAAIAALADAFRRYLLHCHHELGLSRVQPGRFTNPGELEGSALLRFCPLPPGELRRGTNRARMAERFERYREEVVRRFYEEHFSRFDRQIVLVDLLGALNAGPAHFADTQETLALILKSFRYGSIGLLGRLFAPRIDRLLFAVSKADHVAPNQHAGAEAAAGADDQARRPGAALRGHHHRGDDPGLAALHRRRAHRASRPGPVLRARPSQGRGSRDRAVPGRDPARPARARRLDQRPLPLQGVRAAAAACRRRPGSISGSTRRCSS